MALGIGADGGGGGGGESVIGLKVGGGGKRQQARVNIHMTAMVGMSSRSMICMWILRGFSWT